MYRIASPVELTRELEWLMSYARSHRPSRRKLARELQSLARRVGKDFSTQDALNEYLQEHPGADKSKHRVVDHKTESGGKSDEFDFETVMNKLEKDDLKKYLSQGWRPEDAARELRMTPGDFQTKIKKHFK